MKVAVLELVNQERAKQGLPALGANSKLNEAANIRAKEIVEKFSHDRPDGSSCFTVFDQVGTGRYFAVGENIAAGQPTPQWVMDTWMNSSGHRANILGSDYKNIGIGLCRTNSGYGYYWVQLFFTGPDIHTEDNAFGDLNATPKPNFTDMPKNQDFVDAITWAIEKGVTAGTSGTTFSPDQGCTRAQIVTFLWRAAGKPDVPVSGAFSDMPGTPDFQKAISWAVSNGVTTGTGGGKFSPGKGCTRAQIVTFLWRAAGKPDVPVTSAFSDMPSNPDFQKAISWAVANGVTTGTGGGKFSPDKTCTRAQAVTFIHRVQG